MEKNRIKEYSNGELTIVWNPEKCIHAGVCVQTLPRVYNPKNRPWIKMENASTEELRTQIELCPSKALSYFMNSGENKQERAKETKIDVKPNGPLLVHGSLKVTDKDGNIESKENTTAFCRCGASKNKPYCDGSHLKINFKD